MSVERCGALAALLLLGGCGPLPLDISRISEGEQGAYEVSLAAGPEGLLAAWYDTRDGNPEIYLRQLAASGRPIGPELRLTHDPELSYEAQAAWLDGDAVVAWYDRSGERLRARLGRWTLDGTATWVRRLDGDGGDSRNPIVRVHDGRLFCAWLETTAGMTAVWTQWLDAEGEPLGAPTRVAPASETTWLLNGVVGDDGEPWLVYGAVVGTRSAELFLVRGEGARRRFARLTEDDGFASTYPDVVLAGDRVALTWWDERDGNREVYLLTASRTELGTGGQMPSLRVTHSPGESIGAYLGWDGDRLGLGWSDELDDDQHEVHFQTFAASGEPLDAPRRVTDNPTASLIPAVSVIDDHFVLAWNEDVVAERGDHTGGGRSHIAAVTIR